MMSVQSIEQLRLFMLDMEDLRERLGRIVPLWQKTWKKLFYENVDVMSWELDDSDESLLITYSGYSKKYGHDYGVVIRTPAKYLFMTMADIEKDIKARHREYLRQRRKEEKELERQRRQERDEWIKQEYAKIQERMQSTKKKGHSNGR